MMPAVMGFHLKGMLVVGRSIDSCQSKCFSLPFGMSCVPLYAVGLTWSVGWGRTGPRRVSRSFSSTRPSSVLAEVQRPAALERQVTLHHRRGGVT